jgi:NDP-sugar pyrophosphorylase family protein
MKAMILAAGLGTRLKPITDSIPKALVKVNGITLLEQSLHHLKKHGIRDVVINVHHFAGQIVDFLKANQDFGMNIAISDESSELLDTGGGLKKASWFFDDGIPFILRNVDVLSDLDLLQLREYHNRHKGLATLVVRERNTSRYFLFDSNLLLCGWENTKTGEKKIKRQVKSDLHQLAFSGMQVIDPLIFPLISETGSFSITDLYLRLSAEQRIIGFVDRDSFWNDAGKQVNE